MLRRALAFGSFALLAACSSSTDATPTPPPANTTQADGLVGDIRADATWEDGTKLAGVIRIVEGVTVTIAPGAKIACSEAVRIEIGGTLKVDSKDKHAAITCSKWGGIIVGVKGQLDINGLDIENASTGYQTTANAGDCTVKNSVIKSSVRPFTVGENSKLLLDHVDASVPTTVGAYDSSVSEISGSLEAHYLTYQAQSNEGIMLKPNGDATITDSTLKAAGGQDLVSSYGGKSLKLSYTTMDGAHCGIHMQGIDTATVDHVTSTSNLYGVTIYEAKAFTISDSNLGGSASWIDLQGTNNGPVSLNNIFIVTAPGAAAPPPAIIMDNKPAAQTTAAAQIADAVPHPEGT